mmetsp:Transcript_40174/g.66225  ORF Transcript_40174/g.66225 Transcript_40174/m.66225 type:complete len:200 (+) Transcript_40174:258-857(+)
MEFSLISIPFRNGCPCSVFDASSAPRSVNIVSPKPSQFSGHADKALQMQRTPSSFSGFERRSRLPSTLGRARALASSIAPSGPMPFQSRHRERSVEGQECSKVLKAETQRWFQAKSKDDKELHQTCFFAAAMRRAAPLSPSPMLSPYLLRFSIAASLPRALQRNRRSFTLVGAASATSSCDRAASTTSSVAPYTERLWT